MRHEQHITSGVEVVVESMVVDVTKHGTSAEKGVVRFVEVYTQGVDNTTDGRDIVRCEDERRLDFRGAGR